MEGGRTCNKRKPELIDPQILCCEYFPNVPSVKTLAYSFYVLPLETTGKDVHIAFHQENTKNKQKPSWCVAGKSPSSETVAAEGILRDPFAPFTPVFTAPVSASTTTEKMLPNSGGFQIPTVIKIKHPA